ncbi:BAG family molecular chaperone regulator 1 [Trichinella zimbabwensis]|uniref:BAG family molecular chaperone regulator 1 n=2 Tax=Trichinella TaxID=6333 RepID=A0A0V1NAK1_9BILA|nr:BAG family molecular chaperone regulator 1 [Trichinella zimbabwensis]KRZ80876.1 BAG family molecular chaperone regulator 1 [Trichinella papuae]
MKLNLLFGAEKDEFVLPDDNECNLKLIDLKNHIDKKFDIPVSNQKLICRGRTLIDDEMLLNSLNFKPDEKIMIMGNRRDDPQLVHSMKVLHEIEKHSIAGFSKKLREFTDEIDGIAKGYLPDNLVDQAVGKLTYKSHFLNEECMKAMEKMDALSLGDRKLESARLKRKSLINQIQNILQSTDYQMQHLHEFLERRQEEK